MPAPALVKATATVGRLPAFSMRDEMVKSAPVLYWWMISSPPLDVSTPPEMDAVLAATVGVTRMPPPMLAPPVRFRIDPAPTPRAEVPAKPKRTLLAATVPAVFV